MLPLPRAVLVSLLTLSFTSNFGACVIAQDKAALLPNVMQAQADANPLEAQPIMQTSCDSCGGGLYGAQGYISHGSLGCSTCGLGDCGGCGTCFPGQTCNHCVGGTTFENFFCRLHNAICCPDPCYEPLWIASQNVAFFQDSARPVNQTRIRWDHGSNLIFPDRNNYMFAPSSDLRRLRGIRYDELRLSMEAGTERFTVTVDTPYRYWDGVGESKAGFSDIAIATKSLLIDSEILLMAFQFRTTIPSASGGQGLGLGLVSLEPSLLFTLKLWEETYLQTQLAQWIPIGSSDTAGSLFRYNFALNTLLWKSPTCHDMQLVGTFEVNCISFQAGFYHALDVDVLNNEVVVLRPSSGDTYVSVAPGFRYQLCEKMDIGFSVGFNVSQDHFAEQLYRTEFRWRY